LQRAIFSDVREYIYVLHGNFMPARYVAKRGPAGFAHATPDRPYHAGVFEPILPSRRAIIGKTLDFTRDLGEGDWPIGTLHKVNNRVADGGRHLIKLLGGLHITLHQGFSPMNALTAIILTYVNEPYMGCAAIVFAGGWRCSRDIGHGETFAKSRLSTIRWFHLATRRNGTNVTFTPSRLPTSGLAVPRFWPPICLDGLSLNYFIMRCKKRAKGDTAVMLSYTVTVAVKMPLV
jgi:hypothetical protein